MRRSVVVVAFGLLLGLASGGCYAQQGTADIAGRVADEQGAALPGVAITVTNEASGVFREVVSGPEGTFRVSQIVPGRYRVSGRLTGFRPVEQSGLVVQVGTTLAVNLTLVVGAIEETVTVTGQSPLIDTTAIRVGGNVGTAELSQLPAINRNYFSAVALLPGVQFSPSNQMGNDTIVASGQTTQNNNVSVDGGYNADDALGTSAGAQVRTPLEAIQEFQVLTSMYNAEFGRASGAIVNAVTKTGTNQFKGVVFGDLANNAWISEDFFVRTEEPGQADDQKREWGGVIGGPMVRNKTHFFFSLERQVDNPNRTRVFDSRPTWTSRSREDRSNWNTLVRFDHQINANHSWAVRWLRELAPQCPDRPESGDGGFYQDETDLDQTAVGTLTSVLGNSKVNTVRVARTWEHWWHGNECFRAQVDRRLRRLPVREETSGSQALCLPQLDRRSLPGPGQHRIPGTLGLEQPDRGRFLVVPSGQEGQSRLEVRRPLQLHRARARVADQQNGTFLFNTNVPFDAANPRTYPERLTIRMGTFNEIIKNHTYEGFAQDKWRMGRSATLSIGLRYDLEIIPLDETDNPLFPASDKNYPVDKNNFSPRIGFSHSLDDAGKMVVRAGYGRFYNRTILGADRRHDGARQVHARRTWCSSRPTPRTRARAPGQFPTDPLLVNGPS